MELDCNGNMTVKGTSPARITIDKHEQIEVAISIIEKICDVKTHPHYYHSISEDGESLMLTVDHGHHRGGEEKERVRPATMLDKAALLVLSQLEKAKYGKTQE